MKLGLIGYGSMGKIVEQIAKDRGHQIVSIIDKDRDETITKKLDCYIDFSVAESTKTILPELCKMQIPLVTGTTGWDDKKADFEKLFLRCDNRGIWGSNFSLGVNLFWKTIQNASALFDNFSKEYDVMVHEFHHKNKIDSPSGTAYRIAELIMNASSQKDTVVTQALQRKPRQNELHVSSTRGGAIPGTHSVIFDSMFDTIELKHTARSRQGFALGAVLAAEKILQLDKGLHNFFDIFDIIIQK